MALTCQMREVVHLINASQRDCRHESGSDPREHPWSKVTQRRFRRYKIGVSHVRKLNEGLLS